MTSSQYKLKMPLIVSAKKHFHYAVMVKSIGTVSNYSDS